MKARTLCVGFVISLLLVAATGLYAPIGQPIGQPAGQPAKRDSRGLEMEIALY
jgi:hypothetical protein